MKNWYREDWLFRIEVVQVGKRNKPEECRIGFEPGDTFECRYGTPAGFCPTSFLKIFPALEVVRCNGDLRNLGGRGPHEITFTCPEGVVLFRVTGEQTGGVPLG
ncbi:MAG: TIGR04076 family protein [Anaerolineae bacterium]|nr:TIGR04076 family protein [Anaerolineae bacterium]